MNLVFLVVALAAVGHQAHVKASPPNNDGSAAYSIANEKAGVFGAHSFSLEKHVQHRSGTRLWKGSSLGLVMTIPVLTVVFLLFFCFMRLNKNNGHSISTQSRRLSSERLSPCSPDGGAEGELYPSSPGSGLNSSHDKQLKKLQLSVLDSEALTTEEIASIEEAGRVLQRVLDEAEGLEIQLASLHSSYMQHKKMMQQTLERKGPETISERKKLESRLNEIRNRIEMVKGSLHWRKQKSRSMIWTEQQELGELLLRAKYFASGRKLTPAAAAALVSRDIVFGYKATEVFDDAARFALGAMVKRLTDEGRACEELLAAEDRFLSKEEEQRVRRALGELDTMMTQLCLLESAYGPSGHRQPILEIRQKLERLEGKLTQQPKPHMPASRKVVKPTGGSLLHGEMRQTLNPLATAARSRWSIAGGYALGGRQPSRMSMPSLSGSSGSQSVRVPALGTRGRRASVAAYGTLPRGSTALPSLPAMWSQNQLDTRRAPSLSMPLQHQRTVTRGEDSGTSAFAEQFLQLLAQQRPLASSNQQAVVPPAPQYKLHAESLSPTRSFTPSSQGAFAKPALVSSPYSEYGTPSPQTFPEQHAAIPRPQLAKQQAIYGTLPRQPVPRQQAADLPEPPSPIGYRSRSSSRRSLHKPQLGVIPEEPIQLYSDYGTLPRHTTFRSRLPDDQYPENHASSQAHIRLPITDHQQRLDPPSSLQQPAHQLQPQEAEEVSAQTSPQSLPQQHHDPSSSPLQSVHERQPLYEEIPAVISSQSAQHTTHIPLTPEQPTQPSTASLSAATSPKTPDDMKESGKSSGKKKQSKQSKSSKGGEHRPELGADDRPSSKSKKSWLLGWKRKGKKRPHLELPSPPSAALSQGPLRPIADPPTSTPVAMPSQRIESHPPAASEAPFPPVQRVHEHSSPLPSPASSASPSEAMTTGAELHCKPASSLYLNRPALSASAEPSPSKHEGPSSQEPNASATGPTEANDESPEWALASGPSLEILKPDHIEEVDALLPVASQPLPQDELELPASPAETNAESPDWTLPSTPSLESLQQDHNGELNALLPVSSQQWTQDELEIPTEVTAASDAELHTLPVDTPHLSASSSTAAVSADDYWVLLPKSVVESGGMGNTPADGVPAKDTPPPSLEDMQRQHGDSPVLPREPIPPTGPHSTPPGEGPTTPEHLPSPKDKLSDETSSATEEEVKKLTERIEEFAKRAEQVAESVKQRSDSLKESEELYFRGNALVKSASKAITSSFVDTDIAGKIQHLVEHCKSLCSNFQESSRMWRQKMSELDDALASKVKDLQNYRQTAATTLPQWDVLENLESLQAGLKEARSLLKDLSTLGQNFAKRLDLHSLLQHAGETIHSAEAELFSVAGLCASKYAKALREGRQDGSDSFLSAGQMGDKDNLRVMATSFHTRLRLLGLARSELQELKAAIKNRQDTHSTR